MQIYDVEIDRVNKPYLPLAAGEFSVQTGSAIVAATGALSLALGIALGVKCCKGCCRARRPLHI